MSTIPESSVNPTMIVGADARFATTFLSTKYRDKAIAGEVLMDKTSGEIFIKRVSDGKIVSFYQNKKMLNDLVLNLRVLLRDNASFIYPRNNENAFYISTNYDLIAANNEVLYNLITDNISITGAPNDVNKLTFTVSGDSNGFFCRNSTRNADKAFIEFINNQYNITFKNYSGNNTEYLNEYNKFQTNENWEFNDSILTYDVTVIKEGTEHVYSDIVAYIMVNDDTPVFFPQNIYDELGSFDTAIVTIKSITYDKLHFMVSHKNDFDNKFITTYDKLISNDGRVEVAEFNVLYFIDNAYDINLLGNEMIVALVDIPRINRHMSKMDKLVNPIVTISDTKPNTQGLWFKPKL